MALAAIRYPAEWEDQKATWLSFPHNQENWHGERGVKIRKFYIDLIRTISDFQPVNVLVPSKNFLTDSEKKSLEGTSFPVNFPVIKTDDIWIRDYGPFFVKKGRKTVVSEAVFNAWGAKFPPWKNDNQIPARIAKAFGYSEGNKIPYIFVGGAIEVNGDGLGITTLDCLVGTNRNKQEDLSKVIKSISETLGLKSLLILPHGLNGDHTDGHIDNVARFVSKNRVVIAWDPGMKSKNAKVLSEAKYLIETWLKAFYGKTAVVDTLPLPPQRKLSDGQILPASYMNFIYVNGGIIYPKYKCKNDAIAQKYFESVYPDRFVIGLDSRTVIEEGGSLHCMSKHESK